MKKFYVYIHRKKTDNSVFYVGKGSGKRAYHKSGRNSRWNNIVNKHGYSVEILFDELDEETAFQVEKDTILEFDYFGYDLSNMTTGGEGASGFKWTDEMKAKVSKSHKGKVRSDTHRLNLSLSQKGKKKNPESVKKMRMSLTGKTQSQETRDKRIKTLKERGTSNDRNIYLFFTIDDLFVGTRKELSDHTGLHPKKLNTLFQKNPNKSSFGWHVVNLNTLIIFKEIIKC